MNKQAVIAKKWNKYLNFLPQTKRDIYFTEEYVKLYEEENNSAECFVYQESENILIFPYLKRKITILNGDFYDFETAYGYGGPVASTDEDIFFSRAWGAFDDYCRSSKIVCGFIRFHPLIRNFDFMLTENNHLNISYDRKTVFIDLRGTQKELWQNIHPKHRNVIRKAESSGLRFRIDEKLDNLDQFVELYNQRMNVLNADKFYFFNTAYYAALGRRQRGSIFLGLVFLNETIISAALFFRYGIYGHYHLSASLSGFAPYYPNNLLIYKTFFYLKEKGVRFFHLGGGSSRSEDNGLYKFKKRFSNTEGDFYIGKFIFEPEIYRKITQLWEESFSQNKETYKSFLLRYRYR